MDAISELLGDCDDCTAAAKLEDVVEESSRFPPPPPPTPEGANGGVGPTLPLELPPLPPPKLVPAIWPDSETAKAGGGGGGGGIEENCC